MTFSHPHLQCSAVIFDLDGLLADTEPLHRQAYQDTLRRWGIEVTDATYAEHWIRQGKGIADLLSARGLALDPDRIRQEKAVRYDELVRSSAKPMPGAREALNELQGRKPMALATSSYREAAAAVLDTLGIRHHFAVVLTQGDVTRVKPFPDLFLLAARRLGRSPAECVVVEDAEKGIRAACAAGMRCIAVPTEHTQNHDFSQAIAILPSLHALTLALLESL